MSSVLQRSLRGSSRVRLVATVCAAWAIAGLFWLVVAHGQQHPDDPAPPPSGWQLVAHGERQRADAVHSAAAAPAFHPTESQWAALKVETARQVSFDSVLVADGVIANNDNATAAVYSPYSGRVVDIRAQLGMTVRKGQALATILATEAAQSDSDLSAAVSAEAIARKQLETATEAEKRQHDLLLAEAGTQKEWHQSQADLLVAQSTHNAARAALNAVRTKATILGSASASANDAAGRGSITAPIGGVVVQRQISPGQFVSSLAGGGSTPVFTVSDLRTVWVMASVSEADASRLSAGQPVEVQVLALPDRTFRSRIDWVSAAVDPATRRVTVRAELQNPDLILKPQMSATVRLSEGHPRDVIAIARSAVVYDGAQAHCYVVAQGSAALAVRAVQVGRSQGNLVEVTSGLAVGDRVVTRGALFVDQAADDARS